MKQQIGKLDRFVDIVEFTTAKSAIGSKERTQQAVKSVWAQVDFKSSSEDFEEKVYSINRRNYIIHFDRTISAKLVQDLAVIDESKTYYVIGYDSNYGGREMYMMLSCEYRG